MTYARFRPMFGEVIDERYHTLAWLDEQIASGVFRYWQSANAAIVTELRSYPTGAVDLHGIIAAGELSEIVGHLIPQAEDWARRIGCVAAIIESREAWAKLLKTSGYMPHQLALRKEL